MVNTLTLFPNLPRLTFEQALAILDGAKVPLASQAKLSGVSRQSIWLRKQGQRGSGSFTLDRLSALAYAVCAWQAKTGVTQFPPKVRFPQVQAALACVTAADMEALDINAILDRVKEVGSAS